MSSNDFNPSDINAAITLSDNNTVATKSGTSWVSGRCVTGLDSGKHYWEIELTTLNQSQIGVMDSAGSLSSYVGASAAGWSFDYVGLKWTNGGSTAYGSGTSVGDIIGIAVDMDAGKIWFAINNTWQNSGDPAAGTNAAFTNLTGTVYPAVSPYDSGIVLTKPKPADLNYSPPTGFSTGDDPFNIDNVPADQKLQLTIASSDVGSTGTATGTLTIDSSGGGGASNVTYRTVIDSSIITRSGSKIKITLGKSTQDWSFGAMYVGHKGTGAYDFDGNQVQVTVGGSNSATISADGTETDEITFDLDASKDLVIAFYNTSAYSAFGITTGVSSGYKTSTNDASTTIASGYTSYSSGVGVKQISVTVAEALTDFPVLVNLGSSAGKSSFDASAVFDEICLESKKIAVEIGDTGNQCYVEIERYEALPVFVGGVSDSSTDYSSTYDSPKGFDKNDTTRWSAQSGTGAGSWLSYDLGDGNSKTLHGVSLKVYGGTVNSFKIQGSDDNSTWVDLLSDSQPNDEDTHTYSLETVDEYRYYRVYVVSLHSGTGASIYEFEGFALEHAHAGVYPAAHSATYVVADSTYTGYYPYSATDPALSLTGAQSGSNSWNGAAGGTSIHNRRINIDYTTAFVANRFCLENNHSSGTLTDRGIKNFKVYGSNSATAFSTTSPTTLTELTLLGTFIAREHIASDAADPQHFNFENDTAYQYYTIISSDTHGSVYTGIRHMEFQEAGAATAQLWVKVPSLSASADTVLNLYYDSTQSDNTAYVGDTGDTPAQSVWDSNFVAVYHMAQDPSGTAPQILDSTSSGLDITSAGTMTSGDLVDGQIGKAIDFDGSDDTAVTSGNHGITGSNGKTLEATIKSVTTASYGRVIEMSSGAPSMYIGASGAGVYIGSASIYSRYTTELTDDTFHYVVATFSSSLQADAEFFDNAVKQTRAQLVSGTVNTVDGTIRLGDRAALDRPFAGIIDEVRISNVERSADWIAATHLSNTDALITFSLLGVGAGAPDRIIPSFANIPKPYNTSFMTGFVPAGLIRQTHKGFSKAF